jgi:cadmium resistance protein CadD (predicted permease)
MDSFIALLGFAVVFAWTNIDDLFILLGFFSDPGFHPRQVVIGQYVGISALYAASVVASLLSLVLRPAYIGLLGLAPILIGFAKLYSLWRGTGRDERDAPARASAGAGGNIATVAMATLANSGDNLIVYTPLFANRPAWQIAAAGLLFACMTGLWCLFSHWLVNRPGLGAPLRRYGQRTVPFILIGLGAWILYESGSLTLI